MSGWLLDTSIRAENWTWAYFTLLDNGGFSGSEDSLFVYKLMQHGDFLCISKRSSGRAPRLVAGRDVPSLGIGAFHVAPG